MAEKNYQIMQTTEQREEKRPTGWVRAHLTGLVAAGASLALVGTAFAFITHTGKIGKAFSYGNMSITLIDAAYQKDEDGVVANKDESDIRQFALKDNTADNVLPNQQFDFEPTITVHTDKDNTKGAYLFARVTMPKADSKGDATTEELFDTNKDLEDLNEAKGDDVSTSYGDAKAAATGSQGNGRWRLVEINNTASDKVVRTYAYVTSDANKMELQAVTNGNKAVLFNTIRYDADAYKQVDDKQQIKVEAFAIQVENLSGADMSNSTTATVPTLGESAANDTVKGPKTVWDNFKTLMQDPTNSGNYPHAQPVTITLDLSA